jgi:hypothetical protein
VIHEYFAGQFKGYLKSGNLGGPGGSGAFAERASSTRFRTQRIGTRAQNEVASEFIEAEVVILLTSIAALSKNFIAEIVSIKSTQPTSEPCWYSSGSGCFTQEDLYRTRPGCGLGRPWRLRRGQLRATTSLVLSNSHEHAQGPHPPITCCGISDPGCCFCPSAQRLVSSHSQLVFIVHSLATPTSNTSAYTAICKLIDACVTVGVRR